MIQIDEARIKNLIAHRINNADNKLTKNNRLFEYADEEIDLIFKKIFLKPFLSYVSTFEFKHEIGLDYNVLFKLSKAIYENDEFLDNSNKIIQHLISVSKHQNIKDGDIFIVKFEDVKLGDKYYEAVGIYKFEEKESYIETSKVNEELQLKLRKGIGSKKPDKACLIIFSDEPYTIFIIDSSRNETDYWQKEFIKHKPKNDFVNNTINFLSLTKSFITDQISNEFEVSKADKIDLLNRLINYFKERDEFNLNEFSNEVLANEQGIESFKNYKNSYEKEFDTSIGDSFLISNDAVKKQARAFKSVLKLDKNFHIYIHGDKELIEKGYDEEMKMNFYKVYFKEEQ